MAGASTENEVLQAFGPIVEEAAAGRYRGSGGLVPARAARAFADAGAHERAARLWRQAALRSSEERFYGDTRGALRSIQQVAREQGNFPSSVTDAIAALPDRRRLLAAAHDSSAEMLEAAHNDQLPDAFSSARQALWEARLGGHWMDEQVAVSYFADVLDQADRQPVAVGLWVASGQLKKAAEAAATLSDVVDVTGWLAHGSRSQRSAAAAVIAAQAAAVPDADVDTMMERLLVAAQGLWTEPGLPFPPQMHAIRAIAAFGVRIPAWAVDRILEIARPGAAGNLDDIANLLVQTLNAVPGRHDDLAPLVLAMLDRDDPATNLAGLVAGLPEAARSLLRPDLQALVEAGRQGALDALGDVGVTLTIEGELSARRACARLLRRPLGVERLRMDVTTEFGRTARLVSLLTEVAEPVGVDAAQLVASKCTQVGGLMFSSAVVSAVGEVPSDAQREAVERSGAGGVEDDIADAAARAAAGDPESVLAATFERLVEAVADGQEGVPMRLQALQASRMLLSQVLAPRREALARRLVEVSDDPCFNDFDDFNRGTLDKLSRSTFNTGESDFTRVCLLIAAEAAASVIHEFGPTDDLRGVVKDIARRAGVLLRSTDAEDRSRGAQTMRLLAEADDTLRDIALPLRFSPDPLVRFRGISTADTAELASFVTDPSPAVRMQVAARADELDDANASLLLQDGDLRVRTAAQQAVAG